MNSGKAEIQLNCVDTYHRQTGTAAHPQRFGTGRRPRIDRHHGKLPGRTRPHPRRAAFLHGWNDGYRIVNTLIPIPKAVAALSVGFTSGLGLLVAQIAFGTFIFSGGLAPYSSQGVGLILFGNFTAYLIIALAGGYRGAISGLSPTLVVVMALIGTSMNATGHTLFVTTVGALVISATAAGVLFFLVGHFQLSNLMRFIPYPMAAGFVAGVGGVVCLAALVLLGVEPGAETMATLLTPPLLWKWAPGVLFGIALYLAMKRWKTALILPLGVTLALAAYHFALGSLGISTEAAQ